MSKRESHLSLLVFIHSSMSRWQIRFYNLSHFYQRFISHFSTPSFLLNDFGLIVVVVVVALSYYNLLLLLQRTNARQQNKEEKSAWNEIYFTSTIGQSEVTKKKKGKRKGRWHKRVKEKSFKSWVRRRLCMFFFIFIYLSSLTLESLHTHTRKHKHTRARE